MEGKTVTLYESDTRSLADNIAGIIWDMGERVLEKPRFELAGEIAEVIKKYFGN